MKKVYYRNGNWDGTDLLLGEYVGHTSTLEDTLYIIDVDMDAVAEAEGWDGWDPDEIYEVEA